MDPQVVFSRRDIGDRTTFIAHHPGLGKYFKLGAEEHHVAGLLDGERGITEILAQLETDGIAWDPDEVAEFIAKLVSSRLATTVDAPPQSAASATNTNSWFRRFTAVLSLLISQRFPLFNGHAVATKLEQRFGAAFTNVGMVYWCGLVTSGLMIVGTHHRELGNELRRMFDPSLWLVLVGLWAIAKIIHEAGHAIAARHHNVRVGKIGIMFFFMAPLAYIDVTDAWKLKKRWSRVQIALAGVYLELAAAAIAAWTWWLLPDGYTKHLAAQFFLISGPATLLVNANPLLRLDGYYVVSDLTEIPNLRMHGRRQLAGWLEQVLLKTKPPNSLLSGWRQRFATIHAACSVVFQVVWMGGLIVGVAMWARGLGILLAVAALLLWAVLPLSRWAAKVWMSEPPVRWFLNAKRKRLLYLAFVLGLITQYLCVSHSPFARRVPIVVRFHDEQIARASADAFVQSVYVVRGQRVTAGMLLLELADPELLVRRAKMADDLKIAELEAVQLRRRGEISQSAAESENAASLRRRLVELDQQIEGLDVVAKRAGLVVGAQIENLKGRFVKRGQELLRVSDPQEKEILASVAESDMEAYQAAAKTSRAAQVRLRGGTVFQTIPSALRPRARQSLPHPALSAAVGGPLPVEPSPDENEQMRVVDPQLQGLTKLDPVTSAEIHAGQIGTMTISDNRSLVTRTFEALTR